MAGFGNYRRDLAVLDTSGNRIPSIQHNPPSAQQGSPNQIAPWMSANGNDTAAASGFGANFYNGSSDNLAHGFQLSPGFRSGMTTNATINDPPTDGYFDHERRPSLASVTTASSTGSKSSIGRSGAIHKKLQTFFGEDYPGKDGSDSSLPTQGQETPQNKEVSKDSSQGKEVRSHSFARSQRERNLSSATDTTQRDVSPAPSRPRTPVPSSEVVPFLYQDSQVSYSTIEDESLHSIPGPSCNACTDGVFHK